MKRLLLFFALFFTLPAWSGGVLPQSQREHFNQSIQLEKKGLIKEAIQELVFIYDEKSYEVNLRMGWLHYLNGQFSESMTYYQNASNLMPYSIESRLGYVLPASAIGNWNQVVVQYQEILKIDPNHAQTRYRYASILYGREEYNEADKLMKMMVNRFPFHYNYLLLYGWISLELGRADQAKILFEKVLWQYPQDPSALKGMAACGG